MSEEQARFYREQGYVLLKNVFSTDELEAMRAAADAVIQRAKDAKENPTFLWGGRWLSDEERDKLDINGVHDTQFHDAAFSRALTNQKLLDGIEALIGPNIQLHHTKLIVKPPERGAPFPMHQDYPYFPHEKHTMLAASIHLDDANEENGCLRVLPGSHKSGALQLDKSGEFFLPPEEYPVEEGTPCPAKAGDVLVFNYLTVHGSGLNTSDRPRRNWLIQMRDPEDHPTDRQHISRGQGQMLRGIDPEYVPSSL
jgi:phytanoyl-CoA hydroxylase